MFNKKNFSLTTVFTILAFLIIIVPQASGCKKREKTSSVKLQPVQATSEIKTPSGLFSLEETFIRIAEEVKPVVVNLGVIKKVSGVDDLQAFKDHSLSHFDDLFEGFFDNLQPKEYNQESLGSGVIVREDGYILTNDHVIKGAASIKVTLFNRKNFEGQVIGSDPKTDLALIKIKADNLPVAKLGNSDKAKIGSWAIAVGNPYGLEHTITVGVISAKGRVIGLADYEDFLQTDASINPGNSGGPLVNLKGEVIGINTAIYAQAQGIGFAIPINMANQVINSLIEHGKVSRAWLGVFIQDITPELAKLLGVASESGVLVSDVSKDSPAEKAGIKRKDIIKAIDNKEINSTKLLQREVLKKTIGSVIELSIIRDKKLMVVKVTLEELPEKPKAARSYQKNTYYWKGLTVQRLTEELSKHFGLEEEKGVIISQIKYGTPAHRAGLTEGDVIEKVNQKDIESLEDFIEVTKEIKEDQEVLLLVKRDSTTIFIGIGKK
ncbi:Do family serine endopeptidase [bacterium]|nr:Do family serine endopeptidase [bacterium]